MYLRREVLKAAVTTICVQISEFLEFIENNDWMYATDATEGSRKMQEARKFFSNWYFEEFGYDRGDTNTNNGFAIMESDYLTREVPEETEKP